MFKYLLFVCRGAGRVTPSTSRSFVDFPPLMCPTLDTHRDSKSKRNQQNLGHSVGLAVVSPLSLPEGRREHRLTPPQDGQG